MKYNIAETALRKDDIILLFERVDAELQYLIETNTGDMLQKMFEYYRDGKNFTATVYEIKRLECYKGFRYYEVDNSRFELSDFMFPEGVELEELSLYNVKSSEIKTAISRKKIDKGKFGYRALDDTVIVISLDIEGHKRRQRIQLTYKELKMELSRLLLEG